MNTGSNLECAFFLRVFNCWQGVKSVQFVLIIFYFFFIPNACSRIQTVLVFGNSWGKLLSATHSVREVAS